MFKGFQKIGSANNLFRGIPTLNNQSATASILDLNGCQAFYQMHPNNVIADVNNKVSQVTDLSASGRNATQATLANQGTLTYDSTIGQFYLAMASPAYYDFSSLNLSSYTFVIVARFNSISGQQTIIGGSHALYNWAGQIAIYSNAWYQSAKYVVTNKLYCINAVNNGSNFLVRFNNEAVWGSTSQTAFNFQTLCKRSSDYGNMDIFAVGFYNSAYWNQELNNINLDLMRQYNIR